MKLLRNLLFVSLITSVFLTTGCNKDEESEPIRQVLETNFQGVFSEEIAVVELESNSSGVEAKVNMNGQVIDLVTSLVLEKGGSLTLTNQDISLVISVDANEVLTVDLITVDNTYTVVGFTSDQAEMYMGVVDENVNGAMQVGSFNFIVDAEKAKGLIYFDAVDTEPVLFEGNVLSASTTQIELEIERNGTVEQVIVELVDSFGKTNSGGLNVTAVPVTISTSNVSPSANAGSMIIGFSQANLPPYDTLEFTEAKLTSLGSYFNDNSGRFHKLSIASSGTNWNGTSFNGQGSYVDLIFSTSANQVWNIEAVYPVWNWSSIPNSNKVSVADYELDSMYVQENLTKANDFMYESISVANLDISRSGLIYTISGELFFGYPMDANGNPVGNPGRMGQFNYTGTIDQY